jgi:hypothetical protein
MGDTAAKESSFIHFMRELEERYRCAAGLKNRSAYKIYYCQVRPASILTLGINPGGSPRDTLPNGRTRVDGTITAGSARFHENDEHDILDCKWKENVGLLELLTPLLGNDASRIRAEVVKTNLAFRRSPRKKDIDMSAAVAEAAPYLAEIVEVVRPDLVLLTGADLETFIRLFAQTSEVLVEAEQDKGVRHTVFAAARVTLKRPTKVVLAVQVAHASQFAWTYAKYHVVERIQELMRGVGGGRKRPESNGARNVVPERANPDDARPKLIVHSTRNTESGGIHAAMLAAIGPETLESLASKTGLPVDRIKDHCMYWSRPHPRRNVHRAAYVLTMTGWTIAPNVVFAFR